MGGSHVSVRERILYQGGIVKRKGKWSDGAIFLVVADGLCRVIIPHTELPIGILISMIGAPSFIYLMIKKTYGFGGSD